MEHKIPLDASLARSNTMIRAKPPSPTPYLDPIVTRRRPGKSEGAVRVDPTSIKASKQQSFANNQFENYGAKGIARPKPVGLNSSTGNQYLQRRKTVVSADCCKEGNSDLAYLVVNLQGNITASTGGKSSTEGCSPASRRRNTMASMEIRDKSMRKSTIQTDTLKRRLKSTESVGVATPTSTTAAVQEDRSERAAVTIDSHNPLTKKTSMNCPPPPPPYMPPSPPKREFTFPAENLAECSLESNRGQDLSSSCPNFPQKRRSTKRNQLGKTSSLGYNNEGRSAPEVSNHKVAGVSPGTSRKKFVSEHAHSRPSSNASNRPPPHKPRPYNAVKTVPPSSLPTVSPEAGRRRVSEVVDRTSKASPTSPPVLPKKSSLSTAPATSSSRHEGLTTSISSPSLHMRPASPSKPSYPSSHTRQHSLSINPSPHPSPQKSRSESHRESSLSQHSPPSRRPAPPRPAPFVPPHSSSRPTPPPAPAAMLLSPELGSPTKKAPKKKRTSEPAFPGAKDTMASRESRSSSTSISGSLRSKIISGPILKSTTISLDGSQPILNSTTDSPKRLAKNPTHVSHSSAMTIGADEAIYEDVDKLQPVDSSYGSPKTTAQPKPALPIRNRKPSKLNSSLSAAYSTDSLSRGDMAHSNGQEQVYEELDMSDSEECTTMDNEAYIANIQEAWVTLDEDGLYVDDLYVEMRPVSGSPPNDADNATYMEMQPNAVSTPSLQVTSPPPSPAPSNSRDSMGSLPAPASPAPIYEYADLSVVSKKKSHNGSSPQSSLTSDSVSLYYASKDLLTSK